MRYPDGGGLTAPQRDQREQVRFQAAEMFAQEVRPPQVAERLRVSQKSARAWHAQWRAGGIEALRSKGPSGPSSRFRPQWRTELAVLLEQGPAAHGWIEDQRWTLARVATVIGRRRHISLSVPQTWRLLRQMGFTAQVPVHRAAERDEQAVAAWKEGTWPEIKGPGRPPTAGSASRTKPASDSGRPPGALPQAPPGGAPRGRRGRTPVVTVSGRRSGRISLAGLIALRPGSRTRLGYRIRVHHGRRGERRSLSEADYMRLVDGAHQLLKAPVVLVWDRLSTHVSKTMQQLVAARSWLTVFLLPAYAPELNPVEGVWAHCRHRLANLTAGTVDRLETLVRNRLKSLQYRPATLHGFMAETGLQLASPPP